MKYKIIRITTIPESLRVLLKGQLKYINQYFDVIGISSNGRALQEVEKNEGVRTISVEMTRKITPLKDIIAVYLLYRVFRKEKPHIVHTHTPKAGIVGMLAAWLAKVPCRLHTVAGLPLLETRGIKRKLLDFVEKVTYTCATAIYPNSFGLYEIILRNRYVKNNAKIKVIGNGSSNGINTAYFNPQIYTKDDKEKIKQELNLTDSNFIFLFVGRLVKDKGINELIQAFITVHEKYPDTKLLLVGPFEKDLDPLCQETEKEIDNNKNIIWAGYQSDVRPYFAISDVFVFPSYREGFPNVVMQAGAMELPAIVTDINGCNEIIVDGRNGIITSSKDKDILREKMELLYENTDLRNILKSNARKMITSRYEQKVVWEAILKEYQALIA
jgi:glycosyltransferase involved in cell wall biosynthesis